MTFDPCFLKLPLFFLQFFIIKTSYSGKELMLLLHLWFRKIFTECLNVYLDFGKNHYYAGYTFKTVRECKEQCMIQEVKLIILGTFNQDWFLRSVKHLLGRPLPRNQPASSTVWFIPKISSVLMLDQDVGFTSSICLVSRISAPRTLNKNKVVFQVSFIYPS